MKCFAVFVFVALAAVAMAQEQDGDRVISNLPADLRGGQDTARTPETEEAKREKRGYYTSQYSAPYYNGGGYNRYNGYNGYTGYNGYNSHYSTPYSYYRSYPSYGYGHRSSYYY